MSFAAEPVLLPTKPFPTSSTCDQLLSDVHWCVYPFLKSCASVCLTELKRWVGMLNDAWGEGGMQDRADEQARSLSRGSGVKAGNPCSPDACVGYETDRFHLVWFQTEDWALEASHLCYSIKNTILPFFLKFMWISVYGAEKQNYYVICYLFYMVFFK